MGSSNGLVIDSLNEHPSSRLLSRPTKERGRKMRLSCLKKEVESLVEFGSAIIREESQVV